MLLDRPNRLYFDHNATTPLALPVLDALLPYLRHHFGNASSLHHFGQQARQAVEEARQQVAALINAEPHEIVFTSGGTEADNLALLGAVRAHPAPHKHLITSSFEHVAILYCCRALEREGVSVTYLPVNAHGFIDLAELRQALRPETVLISLMQANNEVGTIQPIAAVAAIAQEAGLLLHTDAVQTAGKIAIDVKALNVDLLSLSGHKIYGPKGVGALYIRKGTTLQPLLFGGHSEQDIRPGTENVAGIVGLGAAAQLASTTLETEGARLGRLRDHLEREILQRIPATAVNSTTEIYTNGQLSRVPNTSSIYFSEVNAESLVTTLDLEGIACSKGAACSSDATRPSHVLRAMGFSDQRALSSVRFSLGADNQQADVELLIETLVASVDRLRSMAPAWND